MLLMLGVDAGVTLLTQTPIMVWNAIAEQYPDLPINTRVAGVHIGVALILLQTTNVFSSPVIYFLLNRSYRVGRNFKTPSELKN